MHREQRGSGGISKPVIADLFQLPVCLAFVASVASCLYMIYCMRRIPAFLSRPPGSSGFHPPVSILKPLCGMEHELYRNLRSFCEQDYPDYQVIFGVRDAEDPAVGVVRRIMAEFPRLDLVLVVDGHIHGANLKISNLVNMQAAAKHDFLVIADSDMRVGPDYLSVVVAPFKDGSTGAVTCLYRATPASTLASRFGAMHINADFLPSVLVAAALSDIHFCFGATMAVRRTALDAIGGLQSLANVLADDYQLGKCVNEAGFTVRLSGYVVENIVHEPDFKSLLLHELRWARTVRASSPWGYVGSILTYPLPLALLFLAVSGGSPAGLVLTVVAIVLRLRLRHCVRYCFGIGGKPLCCLTPLRDLLSAAIWLASFAGRSVRWKGFQFAIDRHGQMHVMGRAFL